MTAPDPRPSGTGGPGAVIEEITALGPFFALETHPAAGPAAGPWRPVTADLVAARVEGVREWLAAAGGREPGAVETRVAASVAHLGLTARLVSPALAAAVLHARPLSFALGEVRWQPVLGAPVPLSLPAGAVGEPCAEPGPLAGTLGRDLLAGPVAGLDALFARFGVSPHILSGNTASAVNGAVTMIAAARPGLATRAGEFAALLLAVPPLRGHGTLADGAFRRRSCCLIYRAAPAGRGALCGDCALR